MTNNEKIGEIVSRWIETARKQKQKAAEEIGISRSMLSQMLHGIIPFPKEHLYSLIELLQPPKKEIERVNCLLIGKKSLLDQRLPHDVAMDLLDIPQPVKRIIKIYQNMSDNNKKIADGILSHTLQQLSDLL